ncbi:MAG: NAD-dependent protein deacylase [Bifidobacteriaceae bacterium]|jgi:NAD-dependent deacetylase|nr:NAD-dependent protein deacylase [Bifidobacteriaceae bacterium]
MSLTLQQLIDQSHRIVFFGGAGVSTESGIPDFRSADGLYTVGGPIPPEVILSRSFAETHPEEFFAFYRQSVLYPQAKPNAAHLKLAELERAGRLTAVVTQNIDGLHQAGGSVNVIELHGSVHRNHCRACGRAYPMAAVYEAEGVPRCTCGGQIEPSVVLYEDPLDQSVIQAAVGAIADADMLIIGGTSLVVYPAAGLVDYFRGEHLAVINKSGAGPVRGALGLDPLVITEPIGQVLAAVTVPAD